MKYSNLKIVEFRNGTFGIRTGSFPWTYKYFSTTGTADMLSTWARSDVKKAMEYGFHSYEKTYAAYQEMKRWSDKPYKIVFPTELDDSYDSY